MGEWRVRKGSGDRDPVALARDHEVLEYELDGHTFVFACEVVPNERAGKGVAVMMHLAELPEARRGDAATDLSRHPLSKDPITLRDLAAAFEGDELPKETDLATIVTSRTRARWLFASAAAMLEGATA